MIPASVNVYQYEGGPDVGRLLADKKAQVDRDTRAPQDRIPCPGGCGAMAWIEFEPVTVTRDGQTKTVRIATCMGECKVEVRTIKTGRVGRPRPVPKTFEIPAESIPARGADPTLFFDPPPTSKPAKRAPRLPWVPGPAIPREETDDMRPRKTAIRLAQEADIRERVLRAKQLAGISDLRLSKQLGFAGSTMHRFLRENMGMRQDNLDKLVAWAADVEKAHESQTVHIDPPDVCETCGKYALACGCATAASWPACLKEPNPFEAVFGPWLEAKLAYHLEGGHPSFKLPEGYRFRVTVERCEG